MIKRIIPPIVVLLIIASAVTYYYWQHHEARFLYAGTIESTKVEVPARIASVISQIKAEEGGVVKKDDILLVISCDDIAIETSLVNDNFKRGEKLYRAGSMPKETFEALKSRKAHLDLKRSWCEVKSPLSGRVVTIFQEEGEWVSPGMPLISIADTSQPWAYVYVEQPMLVHLTPGMTVTGYLPELAMRPIDGKILKINEEAEFTPKNVQTRVERTRLVYGIKVGFDNSAGLLKPGMPIEVDLPESVL